MDFFFTIPLHPNGTPEFAFIMRSINNATPVEHYQWKVLPQPVKNSPTICQWYMAQALQSIMEQFPRVYCHCYMDDILTATQTKKVPSLIQPSLIKALKTFGMQVAPEKAQVPAWKYIGLQIIDQTI